MLSNRSTLRPDPPLDVELPEPSAPVLDIDLGTMAALAVSAPWPGAMFNPTLSQVAARPSRTRVRWPGVSRAGYHATTAWNWMRDGNGSLVPHDGRA